MIKSIMSFLRIGAFAALMSLLATPALAEGGKPLHVLQAHWGKIYAVAFSPDGKYAASSDAAGEVIIWNVSDGSPYSSIKWDGNIYAGALVFSPDSKDLLIARQDSDGGALERYSIKRKKLVDEASVSAEPLSLAISKDGKFLVLTKLGQQKDVIIVKSKNFDLIDRLSGHTELITDVDISPDGKSIVSAALDNRLVMWDKNAGTRRFAIQINTGSFEDVAFSPDGRQIAYLQSWRVDIADTKTGKTIKTLLNVSDDAEMKAKYGLFLEIAYHPGGHMVATSSSTGSIFLWDTNTGNLLSELSGEHSENVKAIAFNGDGSMLISGGYDNRVVIWQLD